MRDRTYKVFFEFEESTEIDYLEVELINYHVQRIDLTNHKGLPANLRRMFVVDSGLQTYKDGQYETSLILIEYSYYKKLKQYGK